MAATPPAAGLDDAALAALVALARRLALAAGSAALAHFRSPALATGDKGVDGRFDPVTAADREAEAAIRALLARERPEDAILGEEEEAQPGRSGLTWVIDPIDGTRSFISGVPTWGVLVALDDGTTGRIGIVAQPYIGELFVGVKAPGGPRAWFERLDFADGVAASPAAASGPGGAPDGRRARPIAVRPCAGLAAATLFTTSPEMFDAEEWRGFRAVEARVRLSRYGTDCYAYALLAHGLVDLVIESGLAAYDIAAPKALIEAAGGIVTDWHGGDCRAGGQVVAAGDRRVHAEALALLAPFAR